MTNDELSAKLMESFASFDEERGHQKADELLCDILRMTHPLTVEAFNNLRKWYA